MRFLRALFCRIGLRPHDYKRVDHGPLKGFEVIIAAVEGIPVEDVGGVLHAVDQICRDCGKIEGFNHFV